MNSNESHAKNKNLQIQDDNSKLKSDILKIQSNNKTTLNDDNSLNRISVANQINRLIKYSTTYDSKLSDNQDDSKQRQEKSVRNHSSEQSKTDTTCQLTVANYVGELHKALITECKCNLVDFNLMNATLDFETLSNVSFNTLKAVQDQKIFCVLGYFPKISEEMKNRGWVEKRDPFRPPINYSQYLKSAPYRVNWIESPPLISSKSSKEVVLERMKSIHSWKILKDKRSDFIFVTRKRLVNWPYLHELTSVSQMTSHVFCTKDSRLHVIIGLNKVLIDRKYYTKEDWDADRLISLKKLLVTERKLPIFFTFDINSLDRLKLYYKLSFSSYVLRAEEHLLGGDEMNGLADILKNVETSLFFPRCHYIRGEKEYDAFVADYIITALVGVLEIIVQSIENSNEIFSESGNIPYEMIVFVRRCVFKFLDKRQSGSMESGIWKFEGEREIWKEFMNYYNTLITDDDATFLHKYTYELELDVYAKCKYLLDNVKNYCPQHCIDGNTNTWIIKPTSNCSGHGIILARELNEIKEKIIAAEGWKHNYILQKYIEKPLLVYSCKIDLRQWFLVTNMNPVIVWMYKEGYVRFCANSFSMKNMHESIHLSNVRLQKKYLHVRHPNVPEECMWNYQDLKNHLTSIGQANVWDEIIFPGMSESVFTVVRATTDASSYRANTFQLFGADFVITDTFIPYLIEINSIPGLNPSTSVIANLVPTLLEDIVKVMIDRAQNSEAKTGMFVEVTAASLGETARGSAAVAAAAVATPAVARVTRRFSPPADSSSAAAELHRRWIDRINEKLEEAAARSGTDRLLGYSGRDSLLMTLVSMPRPTPPPGKTAAAAWPEDAAENASRTTAGSMEGRRPRDYRRER